MNARTLLIVLAVVLFLVALLLVILGGGNHDLVTGLTLGGLGSFAAAHV